MNQLRSRPPIRRRENSVKTRALNFDGFSLRIADLWDDITSILDNPDEAPLTLADPDTGVGALQFSPAIYQAGPFPDVRPRDLSELLDEFAFKQGFGNSFDRLKYPGAVAIEGASFHVGDDFIRVWYLSDGKNMMLVTYVCDWDSRDQEASEREMTVRSVLFGRQ